MTSLVKKEKFSFSIEDYYIEHQGTAILDIDVTLEFKTPKGQRKSKDYYEFQQIIHYIDNYLVAYPNETDYWEILNTNLATSLITDKIPTAWDTSYKLAKSVAELTVEIEVQAGSGGPAYTRTSSVTVQAANTKTDSATTPNGFGTHAEKARLRTMGDGRTQLRLTGLEPVDWLRPQRVWSHYTSWTVWLWFFGCARRATQQRCVGWTPLPSSCRSIGAATSRPPAETTDARCCRAPDPCP